jgi:putative restriction endonuclease
MPQSIPAGLTREHVLRTLSELDAGLDHPFGKPTGYELVHDDKRYAPKAVVGLACRYSIGRILQPDEFSGGGAPGQANFVLRELGFTVVGKAEDDVVNDNASIDEERQYRLGLWEKLKEKGGPSGVAPGVLRELGIYGGAQGIWVDKARTGRITKDGVGITVAVLHTGSSYADDLAEDCVIYHYPQTRRPASRDLAEVNATKTAGRLQLPFFVIAYPTPNSNVRDVKLGWIESWDDESRTFLISFGNAPPEPQAAEVTEDTPFILATPDQRVRREVKVRSGQQRFKFQVFKRYGPKCVVCELAVPHLLDAAHIRPKLAQGSDDPRNGLVLCANHHRAFDAGLFAIEPSTLAIHCLSAGPDREALGITVESFAHLPKPPHTEALSWFWQVWNKSSTQSSLSSSTAGEP